MHPTQRDILDSLRQRNSRKFNELLRDTAETSDNVTYHLKQLQKSNFIKTLTKGEYTLDSKGIIYLNNNLELNHDLFPTMSCMLELHGPENTLLVMQKLKQPYLGSIHLPTFGVISTASLQAQIDSFIDKYSITANTISFRGLHRERSTDKDKQLIFDKFFVVFSGHFTSFKEEVDDRQFMTATSVELLENPELLATSRAILTLSPSVIFTESM